MKRSTTTTTPLADDRERVRVKLETDDCDAEGPESLMLRGELLRTIAEQPGILACGYSTFQRLTVFHNGNRWVAEATAEVQRERGSVRVQSAPSRPSQGEEGEVGS